MGILDSIFRRKKLFAAMPSDVTMLQAARAADISPSCECLSAQYESRNFNQLRFHIEAQDTNCDAWKTLEDLIRKAIASRSKEFAPGLEMQPDQWSQIITLPPSIGELKSVKHLYLYGSHLVRIPPEIGEMTSLEEFDAYTSYRLHWLPYEITRCRKLARSRMSTRALYGNIKFRPPFPSLKSDSPAGRVEQCSVCRRSISGSESCRVWISLRVATDVLPLLVNSCSEECIKKLPVPAEGYVDHPHIGGLELKQPPTICVMRNRQAPS